MLGTAIPKTTNRRGATAMSVEENKATIRHLLEELDKGNPDIIAELCTADARVYGTGTAEPFLLSGVASLVKTYYDAFQDYRHRIEDMIGEGDRVAVRMVISGTHRGEFKGMSPTGRHIEYGEILICRFAGGKIVEMWGQEDTLWLMQQLGMELRPKH
jgi:predicted ester cyclase